MRKYALTITPVLVLASLILCLFAGCEQEDVKTELPPQLSQERYQDPQGYFNINPPDGWSIEDYTEDPRGKVAFSVPTMWI